MSILVAKTDDDDRRTAGDGDGVADDKDIEQSVNDALM